MPLREADAIILRSYPLKESDKIVSFYTREYGKLRGVCRGARRPKSGFGGALEPLTHVRMQFFERPNRDLCTVDRCDVVASMLETASRDYTISVGLSYIAEIAEKLLPEREVQDAVFRLMLVVMAALRDGAPIWLPLLYDQYWNVRLAGFLPDFSYCAACGAALVEMAGYHPATGEGLMCPDCQHPASSHLGATSLRLAQAMARTPLPQLLTSAENAREAFADLRGLLHERLEAHLEHPLQSWRLLLQA